MDDDSRAQIVTMVTRSLRKIGECEEGGLVFLGCHNDPTDWVAQATDFSHSSGGQKSKTKVALGLVCGESCLPRLQMAMFSLCPNVVCPVHVWTDL
jgi:hypothetical protein